MFIMMPGKTNVMDDFFSFYHQCKETISASRFYPYAPRYVCLCLYRALHLLGYLIGCKNVLEIAHEMVKGKECGWHLAHLEKPTIGTSHTYCSGRGLRFDSHSKNKL